jgi:hypothetical protein
MSAQYRIATVGTATLCLLWAHSAFAWCCDAAGGAGGMMSRTFIPVGLSGGRKYEIVSPI